MKIKSEFVLQEVAGDYIVVPIGAAADSLQGVIRLNEAGAFLWKQISEQHKTKDSLADALVTEYQISSQEAHSDVESFIASLSSIGCIEE
ncbi:MAG: PqqD family protein [Atopobiaceae bacterium]|nr:PqqD family protein [Atopobiaceae bacterium]